MNKISLSPKWIRTNEIWSSAKCSRLFSSGEPSETDMIELDVLERRTDIGSRDDEKLLTSEERSEKALIFKLCKSWQGFLRMIDEKVCVNEWHWLGISIDIEEEFFLQSRTNTRRSRRCFFVLFFFFDSFHRFVDHRREKCLSNIERKSSRIESMTNRTETIRWRFALQVARRTKQRIDRRSNCSEEMIDESLSLGFDRDFLHHWKTWGRFQHRSIFSLDLEKWSKEIRRIPFQSRRTFSAMDIRFQRIVDERESIGWTILTRGEEQRTGWRAHRWRQINLQ